MKEVSISKDTNTERKSQDRNQTKVENQQSSTYSLAKKYLGVATAALLLGGATADLSRAQSSGSALDLRGSNITDRISPPPLPSSELLKKFGEDPKRFYQEVSQRTSGGETPSALTDRVPPPPRPSSEMFRRIEARDFDSYLRKVSQRTSSRETSQPADNLSSSQKDQVDVRSRNMILGGEISETPSHQLEQDKNKGMEPSSVSEEKIASRRSLVTSLKENPEALQSFKKMLSDKKSRRRLQAIPGSNIPCLDTSGSAVAGTLVPDSEGLPGEMVQALITPSVRNNCGGQVDAVSFLLKYDVACQPGGKVDERVQDADANPSTIANGDNAQVLQAIKNYGRCLHSDDGVTFTALPPGEFTVTISAGGIRASDEASVASPDSKITVTW